MTIRILLADEYQIVRQGLRPYWRKKLIWRWWEKPPAARR